MLQLAPAMIAGIYCPHIGAKWAGASSVTGLAILIASKFGLMNWLLLSAFPGYLAGFIMAGLGVLFALKAKR